MEEGAADGGWVGLGVGYGWVGEWGRLPCMSTALPGPTNSSPRHSSRGAACLTRGAGVVHADGPLVVLDDKDAGQLVQGGHVERLVELACRGGRRCEAAGLSQDLQKHRQAFRQTHRKARVAAAAPPSRRRHGSLRRHARRLSADCGIFLRYAPTLQVPSPKKLTATRSSDSLPSTRCRCKERGQR